MIERVYEHTPHSSALLNTSLLLRFLSNYQNTVDVSTQFLTVNNFIKGKQYFRTYYNRYLVTMINIFIMYTLGIFGIFQRNN